MNYILLYFLLLIPVLGTSQLLPEWPHEKKAVIILTYDDALPSQINIAIPQLNTHGLKGTFFLDGRVQENEVAHWKDASIKGHELANHSLYHPCSKNAFKNNDRLYSENYDIPSMIAEIQMMNKFLYLIDGKKERTYAYPCTEISVGGRQYTDTLRALNIVKYARIGGNENAMITDLSQIDLMQIPSFAVSSNQDAAALIAYAEKVRKAQAVGILMFHGVGGDYISVSAEAHEQFLKYLNDHEDEIWVASFQQVFDYIGGE